MEPQFGREGRAPYAFAGAGTELERGAPLADGEHVLLHGVGRLRTAWRLPRPVLIRVTPPRLVALAHYAFRSDRLLDVPRGAICDLTVHGSVVRIVWRRDTATTATLAIGPWSGPARMDRPLPPASELGRLLDEWLRSGG